jgi:dipeptidyl aminopeptidase/acylaminoacyl peptidase
MRDSPIVHAKNIKTPVLLLQGDADASAPVGQSQEMHRALTRYGVDAQFVLYPGAGHGLGDKHSRDRAERVIKWYDAHLK